MPRSLFFRYEPGSADILARARGKVPVSLGGWKMGIRSGKLIEVLCPKKLGTWPVKFTASNFADALSPDLSLVRIDEKAFVDFLVKEGAEDNSWTMRFWEINQREEWSRAITAGKEDPNIWKQIADVMTGLGRGTAWAGVEFTHAKFGCRVMMHRYPTASIAPWGEEGASYAKVKKRFVDLIRSITKIP